jgi:FdhD protein
VHDPVHIIDRQVWRDSGLSEGPRAIPEETALALTYNGGTYAVMMGTPQNLEDFAIGFSLSEGIVQSLDEIESLEIVDLDDGIELRMWLTQSKADRVSERRRHMTGPTGCGLCGIDSIVEALRPVAIVGKGRQFTAHQVMAAMQSLAPLQKINIETRAVHAAAFWTPEYGIVALREDVGRHNALDKLAGALARLGRPADGGFVVVTSRCSYEMVQKAAAIDAAAIAAVSAPTSLAIETAEQAGLALVAFVRDNRLTVYANGERIEA